MKKMFYQDVLQIAWNIYIYLRFEGGRGANTPTTISDIQFFFLFSPSIPPKRTLEAILKKSQHHIF